MMGKVKAVKKGISVRSRIVFLAVILVFCSNSWVAAQLDLTVHDAINLALSNNESYLRAQQELEKAKNRIYEVRASAFPQLSAGLQMVRNWELPSFVIAIEGQPTTLRAGTYYSWTSSLTITQPIYNGGAVFSAWSAAKMYRKFAAAQLEASKRQLKLDVIKSFYGVVMADELARVATESVDLAQAGLDVVHKMQVQGTVSDYELLAAQVRLANYKPQLIAARAAAKLAHESFNNILGIGLNDTAQLIFTMDSSLFVMPDINLDSAKNASLDARPEVQMMRLQTSMLGKAVSIARAGYRPSINFLTTLQFQAQYDNNRWPDRKDWLRSYFSGVMISIPIFDSWRTPAKVKQAKLDLSQSRLSESELEDNVKLEVEQSWWNYQRARESLTSQGQAVEMARRGLAIARVRYENGVGTQLELFESEVALAMAETNRVRAFYDLATGYAALQKALGEEELIR